MTIEGKIKHNQVSILIDTGATLSVISKGFYVSLNQQEYLIKMKDYGYKNSTWTPAENLLDQFF